MIRIDELVQTSNPSKDFVFPAMEGGATRKLTVGQVVDLAVQEVTSGLLQSGSLVIADRSAAQETEVGDDVDEITLLAWDTSQHPFHGRARYRREDSEPVNFPTLSKFQTSNGVWFLLAEKIVSFEMFGAYAHNSMNEITFADGVDSTAAINAAVDYASLTRAVIEPQNYYLYFGNLIPKAKNVWKGVGKYNCGVQIRVNNEQVGFWILEDEITINGFEINSNLYQAKLPGGGQGMIGTGLMVGNTSFPNLPENSFSPEIKVPRDYNIDEIYITRKGTEANLTSSTGIAFQLSGGSNAGFVGSVHVHGRHSFAMQSHWTGNGAEIAGPHTSSEHPRNWDVHDLRITGSRIGTMMVFSSVSSVNIARVHADEARNMFRLLAGDDSDDYNMGDPNIGASIRIGQLICNNLTTESLAASDQDEAVNVTTQATSKVQTEEGDFKKQQLRMDLQIDSLVCHTDDPHLIENGYGINAFNFYGRFVVNSARITGFKKAARVRGTHGEIKIHFEFTDGEIETLDSDCEITGQINNNDFAGNILHPTDANLGRAVTVEGDSFLVTASDITRNDTSIIVPGSIPGDIRRGTKLKVTGTTDQGVETIDVTSQAFTNDGLTIVDLGFEFPHTMTGVTVKKMGGGEILIDASHFTGCRTGVYVENTKAKIRGKIEAGRFGVWVNGEDGFADVKVVSPVTGLARRLIETYGLADVYFTNGGSAKVSGNLGAITASEIGSFASIRSGGGLPDLSTVHISDATVIDASKVLDTNDNIEFVVSNSTTVSGSKFTVFDILDLEKSGSNINGQWLYHEDGVLECWIRNETTDANGDYTWSFPQPFLNTGETTVNAVSSSRTVFRNVAALVTSSTEAEVKLWTMAGVGDSGGINLHAIGKWK